MKGTFLDFLRLAADKPELAKDLAMLAEKYGFELTEDVLDEELEGVVGGAMVPIPQVQTTSGGASSKTVKLGGSSVPTSGSSLSGSSGDEAGTMRGIARGGSGGGT